MTVWISTTYCSTGMGSPILARQAMACLRPMAEMTKGKVKAAQQPNHQDRFVLDRLDVSGRQHEGHGKGGEDAGHDGILHIFFKKIEVSDGFGDEQQHQQGRNGAVEQAYAFGIALQQIARRGKSQRHAGDGQGQLFQHDCAPPPYWTSVLVRPSSRTMISATFPAHRPVK